MPWTGRRRVSRTTPKPTAARSRPRRPSWTKRSRRAEPARCELTGTPTRGHSSTFGLGVPSNLPAELSTFVGRVDDLPRRARQVAARVAERYPGGVWWVELASLADGALVTDRVARTLGLLAGDTDAVRDYFADRAALVLLDNCEHIVEGVAEFVTAVLRGAGLIRVLATSRHPLSVEGETTWRVPSLAVPPLAA